MEQKETSDIPQYEVKNAVLKTETIDQFLKSFEYKPNETLEIKTEEIKLDNAYNNDHQPHLHMELIVNASKSFDKLLGLPIEPESKYYNLLKCTILNLISQNPDKIQEYLPKYNEKFGESLNPGVFEYCECLDDKEIKQFAAETIKKMEDMKMKYTHNINPASFKIKEIVGVFDKTLNTWLMAEVLSVLRYKNRHIYYIEYKGWSKNHNEFVEYSYNRIRKYDPRYHYYKPSFGFKNGKLQIGESELLLNTFDTTQVAHPVPPN
jgi:hypothetical protein